MKKITLIFIISMLITSCNQELKNVSEVTGLVTEKAMVVSARVEASKIGTEILKKGGNDTIFGVPENRYWSGGTEAAFWRLLQIKPYF